MRIEIQLCEIVKRNIETSVCVFVLLERIKMRAETKTDISLFAHYNFTVAFQILIHSNMFVCHYHRLGTYITRLYLHPDYRTT